ncbi:MAG TPA: hypothetical protein VGK64_24590 [Bryobacteraceae bacterium]
MNRILVPDNLPNKKNAGRRNAKSINEGMQRAYHLPVDSIAGFHVCTVACISLTDWSKCPYAI